MEFDLFELDKILIDLFSEQSSLNEQQTSIMTTKNCDRHYCLIIFNNPSWSQRLRKQRSKQVYHRQIT
jgi:hypothetical protein